MSRISAATFMLVCGVVAACEQTGPSSDPPSGEGEGEGTVAAEGEGEGEGSDVAEGEGEGPIAAEGEGEGSAVAEGEGEGSVVGEGEGEGVPIVVDPTAADEILFQAGLALYQATPPDYPAAQSKFDELVSTFPDSVRHDNAGYLAGRCRYEQGLFADARDMLLAMRAAHPHSPFLDAAAYFTGRARFELADFAGAIPDFEASLAASATGSLADNAAYYLGRAEYEEASLPVAPATSTTLYAAARAALQAFETGYPASTYLDAGRYYLGRANYDDARYLDAIAPLQRVRLTPNSIYADNATYYEGRSSYQLADYATAQRVLEAFALSFPASSYLADADYYAGRSRYALLDYSNAIVDFKASLIADAFGVYADNAAYYAGRAAYDASALAVVPATGCSLGAGCTKASWLADARAALQSFETTYPMSSLIDSGRYYLGRSMYNDTLYADAVAPFSRVLLTVGSIHTPSALYFRGRSHYALATPAAPTAGTTTELNAAISDFDALQLGFTAPTVTITNQYVDNSLRWEAQADADLGLCVAANAALAALQTQFPSSTEIARAQTYLTGKGC